VQSEGVQGRKKKKVGAKNEEDINFTSRMSRAVKEGRERSKSSKGKCIEYVRVKPKERAKQHIKYKP